MANRIHVTAVAGCARLFVAFASAMSVIGAPPILAAQPSFELTGKVLDYATKQPIEGAYVIAGYHEKIVDPAVVKQWCVRTKGMFVGSDGSYHFPVEKLDGLSPASVAAIKPGYYLQFVEYPDVRTWRKQDASSYTGRVIYLSRQNEKQPKFEYGAEDKTCPHAKASADAAASVEFLKIQLAKYIRLGAQERQIGAVRDAIESLQGIDAAPPGALNPKVVR